jgi:hypothetical protein
LSPKSRERHIETHHSGGLGARDRNGCALRRTSCALFVRRQDSGLVALSSAALMPARMLATETPADHSHLAAALHSCLV